MGTVRIIGLVLIVLGVIGLIYGGITYTTHKNVANFGPLQIQTEEQKSIPLPPIISGIVLAVGVILLLARGKGSSGGPPA